MRRLRCSCESDLVPLWRVWGSALHSAEQVHRKHTHTRANNSFLDHGHYVGESAMTLWA
jgi:hypothetical protein